MTPPCTEAGPSWLCLPEHKQLGGAEDFAATPRTRLERAATAHT
jgi:hypothetical protein